MASMAPQHVPSPFTGFNCEDGGASSHHPNGHKKLAKLATLTIALGAAVGVISFFAFGPSTTRDDIVSFDLACIKAHLGDGSLEMVDKCQVKNHGLNHLAKWLPPISGSRATRVPATKSDVSLTQASQGQLTRGEFLSSAAGAAAGVAAAAFMVPEQAALAEATLETRKQAYARYVPRIERNREYWANQVKRDVRSGAGLASLEKEFAPRTKASIGKITAIPGPMRLWASSFSLKRPSEKTEAMLAAVDQLEEALAALEIAAIGKEKDSGIFGVFGAKRSISDENRLKLGAAAYLKGVRAYNKYIEIGNEDLGMSFTPLDLID